jgi:hypothetical protein
LDQPTNPQIRHESGVIFELGFFCGRLIYRHGIAAIIAEYGKKMKGYKL